MKAGKLLQKQFEDFKEEFGYLCRTFGGEPNPRDETAGPGTCFLIPCLWGNLHASIHKPWTFDGMRYEGWRRNSNAAIYLSFGDNKGDCPFPIHGEFNQFSHKWNIHRSCGMGNCYVACANVCLLEFARRLKTATGRKEV